MCTQTRRPGRGGEPAGDAEREAIPQVIFREVNEHIADLRGDWSEAVPSRFVCECGNPACVEPLAVGLDEYERVRADGTRFVVVPGHERPGVERVVESHDRFLVVENAGGAAAIARRSNPREGERDERDAA